MPQDLTRVLLNLIGNGFYAATKRRRDGTEPDFRPALKVMTQDSGEGVEIRVRDNGAGIPPEIKDKLFQPFFTTRSRGTGLGLAIVQKLVVTHNGRVTVGRSPQGGASFQIVFPVRVGDADTATVEVVEVG